MKPSDIVHYATGVPIKLCCTGREPPYVGVKTTNDIEAVTCQDCLAQLEAEEEAAKTPKE